MSGDTPTTYLARLLDFAETADALAADEVDAGLRDTIGDGIRRQVRGLRTVTNDAGAEVARLRAEVEQLERVAYDSATGNAWVDIYEGMHAEVERLTAERDARPTVEAVSKRVDRLAAEWRAENQKLAAEAARLRERVAVLREALAESKRETTEARAAAADDDPWVWCDDDTVESVESLGATMVVRITGAHLRALIHGTPTGATPIDPRIDPDEGGGESPI